MLISYENFNIPLQIQPQAFLALSLVSWVQILLYNKYATVLHIVLLGLLQAAAGEHGQLPCLPWVLLPPLLASKLSSSSRSKYAT